jgi:hypothetical protein
MYKNIIGKLYLDINYSNSGALALKNEIIKTMEKIEPMFKYLKSNLLDELSIIMGFISKNDNNNTINTISSKINNINFDVNNDFNLKKKSNYSIKNTIIPILKYNLYTIKKN